MDRFKILSGSTLKIIALVSMLIDHFAACLRSNTAIFYNVPAELSTTYLHVYNSMRGIGRLAFPIYCFLLIEGFIYTSNRKRYMARLFIFALISEIPFDLCIKGKVLEFSHQNVFFTLALGVLMLYLVEKCKKQYLLIPLIAGAAGFISWFLKFDYSWIGILLIFVLYLFRYQRISASVFGACSICWSGKEIYAIPSFILMNLYNGKRGINLKHVFYIAYPAHLLLYFIIAKMFF